MGIFLLLGWTFGRNSDQCAIGTVKAFTANPEPSGIFGLMLDAEHLCSLWQ